MEHTHTVVQPVLKLCAKVSPLLVIWRQASQNTLEDLAANQSMAVLSTWAQTPSHRDG